MIVVSLFWCATVLLLLAAICFILPPLWLTTGSTQLSSRMQLTVAGLLALLLVTFSYCIYAKLGAATDLPDYYNAENVAQLQNYKHIRPLYARLQRELVKNQLDLKLDLENIDLILNFAQIHSQAQNGKLQPEVQQLLQAVLKTAPQQITALNLLAVNAYKNEQYAFAIDYWQRILQQISPSMRNTEVEQILQNKIIETKIKLQRTSSQTT